MKKMLKNTIFTIVLCLCIFLLTACKGGIKGSEAKAYINDFFIAVADEDYSKAETMLHPERPADLENFFVNIEKEKSIDFQEGIEIERYTGFSSALYDSTIKGSSYELTMTTTVGEKTVEFTIEIVKNDAGYGIYNLDLNT
ncbi:MAG: hypothetical protein IJN93_07435 [Clostridia bacterium]|nr:hypothetical protein [Clostridia bacterium]